MYVLPIVIIARNPGPFCAAGLLRLTEIVGGHIPKRTISSVKINLKSRITSKRTISNRPKGTVFNNARGAKREEFSTLNSGFVWKKRNKTYLVHT